MAPRGSDDGGGIVKSPYSLGTYFVQKQEWVLGERYELVRLLGSGSFSSVCMCIDSVTGERVAIKRIPDVLASPDQAKRVLREVAILRRLAHPNVISLRDAFTRPSATGRNHFIGGKLVPSSIDAYLVMEFADGGDLFGLRGQLAATEVRSLMAQLMDGLQYLHSQSVWHRDLKSSNVLLSMDSGRRNIKIADLGSARSAASEGYHWAEQPEPGGGGHGRGSVRALSAAAPDPAHMPHLDAQDGGPVRLHDLYVRLGSHAGPGACGLASPLTRMVATPCYRAPEVVMSRGGYTSAIDMWSAGCIFGELLHRVTYVGSAATPQLQVAPLFAIHGMPKTPASGDTFAGGIGSHITHSELQALFDVIGTPSWADAASVTTPAWRHYLQGLPGKAPTLYRRMGAAGEPAVHLLSRLLSFEPRHRASAGEALSHEYFFEADPGRAGGRQPARPELAVSASGAIVDGIQAMELEDYKRGLARSPQPTPAKRQRPSHPASKLGPHAHQQQQQQPAQDSSAAQPSSNGSGSGGGSQPSNRSDGDGGNAMEEDRSEVSLATSPGKGRTAFEIAAAIAPSASKTDFDHAPDPASALAAIEAETGDVNAGSSKDALKHLRHLLEREIEAQHAASLTVGAAAAEAPGLKRSTSASRLAAAALLQAAARRERRNSFSEIYSWEGLQEDPGAIDEDRNGQLPQDRCPVTKADAERLKAAKLAPGRLANVADTVDGVLDPARYLKQGRHGDWTPVSGSGPRAGPSWGVTSLPPGSELLDPRVRDAIQAQQRR